MKISRSHLFAVILVICASSCSFASDIYVSQNETGGNTGADCADARSLNSLVAAAWIPGNTIHLCGIINIPAGTAGIVAQGSGTSSQPITIKFEPGAILQSQFFGGSSGCWSLATCNGGIEIYGFSYIIIDGGTNGIIQDMANGTNLANHQNSAGVVLSGSNFIVRNLTIRDIYVNDPTTGTDQSGQNTVDVLAMSGSSNVAVCNNHLSNSRTGIATDTAGGTAPSYPLPSCASNTFASGVNLYGNTLRDHAWHFQPAGSNKPITNIFGNDVSGVANWTYKPNVSSYYHTDGVIAWGDTGSQLTVHLFNNLFHDTAFGTAAFYCTYGTAGSGCAAYVFNNIFAVDGAEANTSTAVWLNGTVPYPLGPYYLFNNTFVNNGYMVELAGDSQAVTIENNLVIEGTTGQNYFYMKGYGSKNLSTILIAADYNSFSGGRGYSFTGNSQYFCWPQSGGSPSGCGSSYNGPWVNAGFDRHSVSGSPQIDANFHPSGKSPVINAGANLSSLCSVSGLGPLCYDKNGAARPLTGRWSIGAIEVAQPNPPVGLTGTVK